MTHDYFFLPPPKGFIIGGDDGRIRATWQMEGVFWNVLIVMNVDACQGPVFLNDA